LDAIRDSDLDAVREYVMKLDKDTLIKQRFWVLLALSVPLTLIALFLLWFVVPSVTSQERKKVETNREKLKGVRDLKNDSWIKLAKEAADRAKAQETNVWQKAWNQQQDVITWPTSLENEFHFKDGLFANVIAIQGKDAKLSEQPEDTPQLFHGELTKIHSDYIDVTGRKNVRKRFQRVASGKIYRTEEADKTLSSEDFGSSYDGKRALVAVIYQVGKYFGDSLTETERARYMASYKDQLRDILAESGPLNALDDVVVQFKGWSFRKGLWKDSDFPPKGAKFFRYVSEQWKHDKDISDETWAAQEDLCLQREMFRLVRQANEYVARFQVESQSEDKKMFKVKNPNWRLELHLKGDKLHIKITNLLERRQRVDVGFRVQFEPDKAFHVIPRLNTNPLAPHGMTVEDKETKDSKDSKETKEAKEAGKSGVQSDTYEGEVSVKDFRPKGIYAVEEVLTWQTAAVKRIDEISFGVPSSSHSHRTSDRPLLPYRKIAVEVKPIESVDPTEDVKAVQPLERDLLGEKGLAANLSPNGLVFDRYVSVTPQARRVPIAIALVVDQVHVHRVLNSFADSKLRFLVTQVVWHRYPLSVRPSEMQPISEPGGEGSDLIRQPPPPKFLPPMNELPGGEGTARPTAVTDDPESNVELIIYGIATLYERYPPRQQPAPSETEKQP
jgi:hypothetical protein